MKLTISQATQLVNSNEEFPVDFDGLWQWVGYSRKSDGKAMLVKNFEQGLDYEIFSLRNTPHSDNHAGLSPVEAARLANTKVIKLTVTSAKEFAMLAQTDQGKEVRKYFIEAEKVARDLLAKEKVNTPVSLPDIFTRFKRLNAELKVNKGYFAIATHIQTFLSDISEEYDWSHDEWADLIDGSVGKCWANYCKDNLPLAYNTRVFAKYKSLRIHSYKLKYLGDFAEWFEDVYIPEKFPAYIKKKQLKGQLLPVTNTALNFVPQFILPEGGRALKYSI